MTGSRFKASRSWASNSSRRLAPRWRERRSFNIVTQSAMAAFNSTNVKNVRFRSLATIHLVASSTAASTLALSRGFIGRAGTMAVS